MDTEIRNKLLKLGLAESEVTVYLAMVGGCCSALELIKATGLKRPTVYYALGCLERRGLVAKNGHATGTQFALAPAEHLTLIAQEQVNEAQQLATDISAALPLLTPASSASEGRPSVSFFEGREAVARVLMDMLYAKNRRIDTLAPTDNFFQQMGKEFVERFVTERKQRNIHTRSLWEAPVSAATIKKYYERVSEVRIVPAVMRGSFATSVFIYDDQVLYVSSLRNSYAILIASKEHKDTMRAWFNGLWEASKPHGPGKKDK